MTGCDQLTRGGTVLVVEDDPCVRRLASRILGLGGYRALEAASAGEAMRRLGEAGDTVDLVLADVHLGETSGPRLKDILARVGSDLPVILMSGDPEALDLHCTQGGTARLFLEKPFTLACLLDAVGGALARG
ncbi:MAG: response regulator [Planctomycetes bacterium]|nr:response regulator [Planctomycetota bacterium]